jgi:hypothetical protein
MRSPSGLSLSRLAAVVLPCVVLGTVLHAVGPEMRYPNPSSILGVRAVFVPIVSALVAAVYAVLAVVFWRDQQRWQGRGWRKGLRFAAAYVPFWTSGVLFMPVFFGSSWTQELYTAAADLTVMLAGGALAGLLLGRDGASPAQPARRDWSVLPTMLAVWLVVRYGLQRALLGFLATHAVAPAAVLAWEICMGLSVGILWLMLGAQAEARPLRLALWVGGWLFGSVYALSAAFVPLFVTCNLVELALSVAIDIATVIGAVYGHALVVRRHARLAPRT